MQFKEAKIYDPLKIAVRFEKMLAFPEIKSGKGGTKGECDALALSLARYLSSKGHNISYEGYCRVKYQKSCYNIAKLPDGKNKISVFCEYNDVLKYTRDMYGKYYRDGKEITKAEALNFSLLNEHLES